MRSRAHIAVLALGLVCTTTAGAGEDPAAAAARIFPAPLVVERRVVVLTDDQSARMRTMAGTAPTSRELTTFVAREPGDGGAVAGHAYLDRHLVRTLEETLLVAVDPAGRVLRVEVVEFAEPPEYRASERWLAQFEGRALAPELQLKRGIRTLAGATLSARAATDAVRRVLAAHAILHPDAGSAR